MSIDKKVWLITGASSGFGKSLAQAVIKQGDYVAITARRLKRLEELAKGNESQVLTLAVDMTDSEARNQAVNETISHFGRIDVLANVAGSGSLGAVEEFSEQELRSQFELNFFATAELTRAILPHMREQGSGHILTVTSVAGLAPITGVGPYCASKFALEAWTETLAKEVESMGIKVTLVEPGSFRTGFAGDANVRPKNRIDSYQDIVGPVEVFLENNAGNELGDPNKAAEVMIKVTQSPRAPKRLMLGADAFTLWDRTIADRIDDINTWKELGLDTACEGAQPKPIGE
ncbi:oxidoreductase (plasmid) [Pseudoalteromonas xiamenensis]|uniref:oxidoreductase n=1 Tax=Pseudoalteromonas xiamenensis TaxID=882626 RepID=UPI0027E4EE8D|nr:oxidoreductase [Pseudoalteromonas xiamenensis]WMN61660.1 oxidoreductase [Pseudoalteromonas xiamenensis]